MKLEQNQLIQGLIELKWMSKEAVPLLSARMYENEKSVVGKLRAHGLTGEAIFEAAIYANQKSECPIPIVDLNMIHTIQEFDLDTFATQDEMRVEYVVPLMRLDGRLIVATADAYNEKFFDVLALRSKYPIDYWLADSDLIHAMIGQINSKRSVQVASVRNESLSPKAELHVSEPNTSAVKAQMAEVSSDASYSSERKEPTLAFESPFQEPKLEVPAPITNIVAQEMPANIVENEVAISSQEQEVEEAVVLETIDNDTYTVPVDETYYDDYEIPESRNIEEVTEEDPRFVSLRDSALDAEDLEARAEPHLSEEEIVDETASVVAEVSPKAPIEVTDESVALAMRAPQGASAADLKEVLEEIKVVKADIAEDDIIEYLNFVLLDAITQKASDIHFEPYESSYRIRFRIDGILYKAYVVPEKYRNTIAARLKVMAELDIAEKRLPQDGHITICLEEDEVDARISVIPTLWGEKIVIRLLDNSEMNLSLAKLGLTPVQKHIVQSAIEKAQGLVLVTGPTGSGKTVTLYACLNHLNQVSRNIATVEDPIEINLEGVNQLQVHPKIGLDFAQALRAFLRQDPDVLMVGEIRDYETADITMKAAQTGHLVLSTLHTNSAVESLDRLKNMGIEPYNIASSVDLVIAQRLVRELCHCKEEDIVDSDYLETLGFTPMQAASKFYRASGCSECHGGYRGRFAIFEVMPVSKRMSHLILEKASLAEIREQATREGVKTLRQAGIDAVMDGRTSLEEVLRVTAE